MARQILYCGDDDLGGAARYLAACLHYHRISFDHVGSQKRLGTPFLKKKYRLYILSDYPSQNLTRAQMIRLAEHVRAGASLLMIGGWGSFTGVHGRYRGTPIEGILPVECLAGDDRIQGGSSYRIARTARSSVMRSLDFGGAPGFSGYNRVRARKNSKVILEVESLKVGPRGGRFRVIRRDPLLVIGQRGGRVGAFTTDLAPHWAGGLVDWGPRRIALSNGSGVSVEVGKNYLKFVGELVSFFL